MKISWILLLLLVVGAACDKKEEEGTSPLAASYLEEMLDIMEENSINRKKIDWPTFRTNARNKAEGAKTIVDLHPAIELAVKALGDDHSFYQKESIVFGGWTFTCTGNATTVTNKIDGIGYIKVAGCSCSGSAADQFAVALQEAIKKEDRADLKGWIVDLRGNTGGNMWPMVSGFGPILGEGIAGYFYDANDVTFSWSYSQGKASYENQAVSTVPNPYTLIKPNPVVAVLLDQACGSSGEAAAISFVGRAKTRSFGVGTCGLSTGNTGYQLSDGAMLYLTTTIMADRNKVKKGGPIVPDETVSGDQQVVAKAIEWINQQ